MSLVEDQPDLRLRCMVLGEPVAPLFKVPHEQCLHASLRVRLHVSAFVSCIRFSCDATASKDDGHGRRPTSARCVDAAARGPGPQLRQRLAPGPGMPPSQDGVENHGRVVRTVRIFATADIRRHRSLDGAGPHPFRRAQFAAHVETLGKGLGSETTDRHRRERMDRLFRGIASSAPSAACKPAPWQRSVLSRRHAPDRGYPIGERAGKHRSHGAAVGEAVCIDPRRIDVVGRLQCVDQRRDEPDILHEAGFRLGLMHAPDLDRGRCPTDRPR